MAFTNERYESLRAIFQRQRLPLAFDANVNYAACIAQGIGKTLRIGTESIRCPALMDRALAHPSSLLGGFLTFTAAETAFLANRGHDDFILAYPTVQPSDMDIISMLTKQGKQVSVMVDHMGHLKALEQAGKTNGVILNACLEIYMAYRPFGTD
jgi:D-serine deaminase-like pyridoxal phosphate-dependent protein